MIAVGFGTVRESWVLRDVRGGVQRIQNISLGKGRGCV